MFEIVEIVEAAGVVEIVEAVDTRIPKFRFVVSILQWERLLTQVLQCTCV